MVADHLNSEPCGADIADFSAVRVLVLLDNERVVKPSLVVRRLCGSLSGIAKVRVVRVWTHPDGAPLPVDDEFSDWGDDDDGDHSPNDDGSGWSFFPSGATPPGPPGPPRFFSTKRSGGRAPPRPELVGLCRALVGHRRRPAVPWVRLCTRLFLSGPLRLVLSRHLVAPSLLQAFHRW